jgi:hypothetical protein
MPTIEETIERITNALIWDERIARVRQIPAQHGTNEHARIFAEVARRLYVPHLGSDYAYVHIPDFYQISHFDVAYVQAAAATCDFTKVSVPDLTAAIQAKPTVLLPLRVITGLTSKEFAASTRIVAKALGLRPLGAGKVDSMERSGSSTSQAQARVAAETID